MTTTHQVITRHNLSLANKFIEDDVATLAYEIDPNDETFEMRLT